MQKLGRFLLANNLRSCLVVFVSILIPYFPLTMVAAIVTGLVTLQRGALVGLGVVAWAALPAIATGFKFTQMSHLALHYDLVFVLTLVVWGYASLLRYWRSWSRLLEISAAVGLVLVLAISLLPADLLSQCALMFKQYLVQNMREVMQQSDVKLDSTLLSFKPDFLLGLTYAIYAFWSMLFLMLARAWQLLLIDPAKKKLEFYHIRIGRVVATLAGLVIVLAAVTQQVWLSALVPIAIVLFLFAGLSLVRYVIASKVNSAVTVFAILVLLMLMIMLVPQIVALIIVISCIADSWVDLRKTKILA